MTIARREQEILRIKAASFQPGLATELESQLRQEVVKTVQATLEEALVAEVNAHLAGLEQDKPRRSGYYERALNTQYGRIDDLHVPKLRFGNPERDWQILERYQRTLTHLLDYASYLYVMGLSIRDLQEALYFLLNTVLSRSAINQVTLRVEERMHKNRQAPLEQTPAILIVDGVWVTIQYPLDDFKLDKAGHERQCRQAEDRVVLVAMAVWPDGAHHILHYSVCASEETQSWLTFLDELIARHLDPQLVKLVVSDGSKGLLAALTQRLPQAVQQRCITHKVRSMKNHLTYQNLPEQDDSGQPLTITEAKDLRLFQIQQDAYAIYDAPSLPQAQAQLADFIQKWQLIEPQAVRNFTWGSKRTFAFYRFPKALHTSIRTTNLLERFFREFRNKADEIGAFPNENSCLTLFFLVFQREHAKHDRFALANHSGH
jgi:transposase-like protein